MKKNNWSGQLPMALFPDEHGNIGKLEIAFWNFHHDNPVVYQYLIRFATEWRKRRGLNAKLGIGALFERVRWEVYLGEQEHDFKLNNNNRASYARLMMRDELSLQNIFQLRRQRIQSTIGPPNDNLPSGEHVA